VHYNKSFLNSLYGQCMAEGGTQRPDSNLIMMELNDTAQLTPWLNMTPNLQYVVNPDGQGALAYPVKTIKNAFVVGLQFQIDVADLLGLSIKPPAQQKPRRYGAGGFQVQRRSGVFEKSNQRRAAMMFVFSPITAAAQAGQAAGERFERARAGRTPGVAALSAW
jgi:hypothetical protein